MVYDILKVFKQEYQKNGDALILGSYNLKDGLYAKINKDKSIEYFISKTIKNEKYFSDLDGNLHDNMYDWFKQRDYYSNVVETAKSYDAPAKSIHNNNYYTLFMKANKFYEVDKKHIRDKLYLTVLNFKKFNGKKDIEIIKKYSPIIKKFSRKRDIIKKYNILIELLENISKKAHDLEIKNYIKIFFDESIDDYKKESEIYLSLKVFNDNKYNQKIKSEIFGLSNSNMGLNSKKPFLENKNRKLHIPFIIKNEDALMLKKFFDWLKVQPYNQDRYLDEDHFFIQKGSDNDEAIIKEFDYIPFKIDTIKKSFKSIYVKNYLNVKDKNGHLVEDYEIKELWQLEKQVDELFYNGQLKFNYFKDEKDIKISDFLSKQLQSILYITKFSMLNYFKKYDDSSFYVNIEKYGTNFIINHLLSDRELRAKKAMNLKIALENQRSKCAMDIKNMQSKMNKNLTTNNYNSIEETEFFYLCGQVVKYLLNQSEAHEKKADMLEPYFRANNSQKLKKHIEQTYFKYKHKINLNHIKFNNAISLIMAFEENIKLSNGMDYFLIGALSENIFYMKKEEN